MSKAFTRESDDESGAEEIPSFRPQLPPDTRNYITREGADRLKQRLNDLLEKKQAMATMINAAGTGSEADQRKIESTIRRLRQILDSVVVAEIPVDQDKVAFGAVVMIRHGNGERKRHTISWAWRRRTLNAARSVGFHRWRGRYFLGERMTRCGFDRQKGMRN